MALSSITVKGVTPDLSILGSYQRFSYEDNVTSFQLDNIFVSTELIPSQMNFEFRNSQLSGFRWYHATTDTDTFGSLALQSFVNAEPNGTDIIIFGQDGSINFVAPITVGSVSIGNNLDMNDYRIVDLADPIDSQDGATKSYVDSAIGSSTVTLTGAVTGSGTGTIATTLTNINTSQVTNFDTAVKSYNLNQFVAPSSTLNMGSQKISHVALGETGTDAANCQYVDDAIAVHTHTTTLTGAVTGSGTGTIATTLTNINTSQVTNFDTAVKAYRLDQLTAPTTSVSMNSQKLINLATPTLTTDATTKAYVDGKTITLTGAVTGTGALGSIATTLTNINTSQITNFDTAVKAYRLDQLTAPTTSVSMNSQKLINLATPTLTTDAATKDYVDKNLRSAVCYSTNNATTNTLTANVAQKIAGITDFLAWGFTTTVGVDNRIIYSGPESLWFYVHGGAQISSTVASINVNLEIVKNGTTGVILPLISDRVATANVPMALLLHTRGFNLATNDYIELYIKATSNTTITVSNMIWTVKTIGS
jgi:hypothetical protein